jgi:hypothetical protein
MRNHSRVAVLVTALLTTPAMGHHSSAQFDTGTEIVLEGVVTKYDWRNPHVYMTIEITDTDGEVRTQEVEAGASSILLPLGLTPDSVSIGERVTITGSPNKRGENHTALGRYLAKEDGTVLPLNIASRNVREASTAEASSIGGTWFAPRAGFTAFLGGRGSWQLTEKSREMSAEFNSFEDGAHVNCIPVTAPTLMVYPVVTQIDISDEQVVFEVDWMKSQRIVYLDGRNHPEDGEPTLHGHSIGHWEGDTLVVDTRLYAEHPEGLTFGLASGTRKHTVERFSVSEDRRHLDYEVVLEDPEYLVEPIRHSSQWEYRPDLERTGLACDLDVARRFLEDE